MALGNVAGTMSGRRPTEWRDAFLVVVDDAESSLRQVADEASLQRLLHTERYWQIRRVGDGDARPIELINAEIRFQKERADDIATHFSAMASQNQQAGDAAVRVVLDTNVFLHYRGYDEIDWINELKEPAVRLVCSIVTVRELDDKKNGGGKLGERAGRCLSLLRRHLAGQSRGPAPVPGRVGVTVEVPVGYDHIGTENADQDVIDTAVLMGKSGGKVTLATGDLSMQMRGEFVGLATHELGDRWRLAPVNAPIANPDTALGLPAVDGAVP